MTDPRTALVATTYDEIADRFAEWQGDCEDDPRGWWREQVMSRLHEGTRVLELGCGAGRLDTRVLAERFAVTGVDISAEQITRARSNVPGATFVHADLTELELEPGSFDAVVSFFVFNHVPRDLLAGLFARIQRWLVPGGLLLVSLGASDLPDWTGKWLGATTFFSGFPPDANRRLLTDAGFRLELDEIVTLREPEGDVAFHWILANMSCGFDLTHYGELIAGAQTGGYRFAHFDGPPVDGTVILRHDVDLSLDAALRMAEIERDAGASATYFLMTESVFYNLDSTEGVAAIARLRGLGHRVALHAVYPNAPLEDRFDPVVAWHNPDPEYMRAPLPDGRINVMQEPWFDPATYRSDSNQHWRSGCPHDDLRSGAFPWLQLLTHPEIWAYDGETMGQTMRSMLDAEKERRLDQLRADRIDLS